MNHWLTTILIFLPFGGALVVAAAPLSRYWLGSLAALISLVEVGFWISDLDGGSLNVRSDVSIAIMQELAARGIEIPFPRRDIRVL